MLPAWFFWLVHFRRSSQVLRFPHRQIFSFLLDLSSSASVFKLSFLEFGSEFLLCGKSTSKPDNMSKFGKFSSRSSAIIEKTPAGEQREFTGTIVHRFGNSIDQSERA